MKPELEESILEELNAHMAAHPVRPSKLIECERLIGAMRERGASWRIVQRFVAKAGIDVSAEAIRAYWHRHHKSRRRPTPATALNPKTKTTEWTFNAPSKLE